MTHEQYTLHVSYVSVTPVRYLLRRCGIVIHVIRLYRIYSY